MKDERSIEELIEASSLGTPATKAIRESVPVELAQEVVRRANGLRQVQNCGHADDEHGPYGCTSDDPQPCWCGTPRHLLVVRGCAP